MLIQDFSGSAGRDLLMDDNKLKDDKTFLYFPKTPPLIVFTLALC